METFASRIGLSTSCQVRNVCPERCRACREPACFSAALAGQPASKAVRATSQRKRYGEKGNMMQALLETNGSFGVEYENGRPGVPRVMLHDDEGDGKRSRKNNLFRDNDLSEPGT